MLELSLDLVLDPNLGNQILTLIAYTYLNAIILIKNELQNNKKFLIC